MDVTSRILIVDDDPTNRRVLVDSLRKTGYETLEACDGESALEVATRECPDLILLDVMLPGRDGFEVCKILKGQERTCSIPVIFLTASTRAKDVESGFSLGASDYITKPFNVKEVRARVAMHLQLRRIQEELVERNARLEQMTRVVAEQNVELRLLSRIDPLTGLLNRRAWEEMAQNEHARYLRNGNAYALIMIDVDHFKQFNDTKGHQFGDDCLRKLAECIRSTCRQTDAVGRYGGEEFVVIAPETGFEAARALAERIRQAVFNLHIPHSASSAADRVTLSLGVSPCNQRGLEHALRQADDALYSAKRNGRNRVSDGLTDDVGVEDQQEVKLVGFIPIESSPPRGEQARMLVALLDFCRSLGATDDLNDAMDQIVSVTASLVGCRRVSIMLPAGDGKSLAVARMIGVDEPAALSAAVPIDDSIAGQVFTIGRSLVVNSEAESGTISGKNDDDLFVSAPMVCTSLGSGGNIVGVLNATDRVGGRPFDDCALEYIDMVANIGGTAIRSIQTRKARDEARDLIMVALAKLAERRDSSTGGHVDRVTQYSLLLARELRKRPEFQPQIDDAFLYDLERATPLHDIGKVAIPDRVLLKPGRLNAHEMAVIRTHSQIGAETIRNVRVRAPALSMLKMAEEIAACHHEWYDGSGYLEGLKGDAIPLSARIVAVADAYDALTSDRIYRKSVGHESAIATIVKCSATQFDPAVVQALLRCDRDFKRLSKALTDHPKATTCGRSSAAPTPVESAS